MELIKYMVVVALLGLLSACEGSTAIGNGFCGFPIELDGDIKRRASGYVVSFHQSVNVIEEASRLVNTYEDIEIGSIYGAINALYINMGDLSLERVRCEERVRHIAYNTPVTMAESD